MKVFLWTANICPMSENLSFSISALVTLTAVRCVAVAIGVGYRDCTSLSHLAARTCHPYVEISSLYFTFFTMISCKSRFCQYSNSFEAVVR